MSCPFIQKNKLSFWGRLKDKLSFFSKKSKDLMNSANLQIVLDNAVEGIVTANEHGIILSFNKAAEKMFGYAKHDVLGKNLTILMPKPYCDEHDQYIQNYLRTGFKKIIGIGREVKGMKEDGTIFPINLAVSEVNVNGARFFTGLIQDLTVKKSLDSIRESNQMIKIELQAQKNLLSTASHDFKTPIHSIKGFVDCLMQCIDGPIVDAQKESLKRISQACDHLSSLAETFLNFAKESSGLDSSKISEISIEEIVNTCIYIIIPLAKEKKLEIKANLQELPLFKANPLHIKQIVLNLLSNAVKCSEKGPITVVLQRLDGLIQLIVKDVGCGIDKDKLSEVFIPYSEIIENPSFEHHGLGLSITKHLVEIYGGKIEVISEKGKGTTFTVSFPILEKI